MLDFHPLANLFPLIEGKAFDDLVEDIRINGLLERIVIYEGMILDGRNRYRAGIAAGRIDVDAPAHNGIGMQQWCILYLPEFEGDPLSWVLSKNLHRRHLDESQRSMVASKLETLGHGGRRREAPLDPEDQDANLHLEVPEPVQIDRKTAADMLNVSPRSVASAKKVIEQGAPELVAEVEQGRLAVSVAEKIAALPRARQTEIMATTEPKNLKTVAKQEERNGKELALATKQRALPTKLFGVILGDPAWRFEPYSRDTGMDRAADNHYPTQETSEIKALPVGTLAANDCVLFLWATPAMLQEAMQVMRFWGFEYKSQIIWNKDRIGTGYWVRSKHEILLIGTRGNVPAPAPGTQWDSVIDAPVGEHSAKPDVFYELIESYFPNLPKIELNARRARAGWDAWGLEAPEEDAGPVLPPAPGPSAPIEITIGGMRKFEATLGVHLHKGLFSGSYDMSFQSAGGSGPIGEHASFPSALKAGLALLRHQLAGIAAHAASETSDKERASARGGVEWIDRKVLAWGLSTLADDFGAPNEEASPADQQPDDALGAYQAALAASEIAPGTYARSTVEPILSLAYAAEVPIAEIADDLGHPVGTIKTWAHHHKLTDRSRMLRDIAARNAARHEIAAGGGAAKC